MKHKVKVLYPISAYFPSQVGGPANSVYWMCEGLKESKVIDTKVISTSVGIDEGDIELKKWYHQENNSVLFIDSKGMLPLKLIMKSISYIKNSDIIHFSSFFHAPSLILTIINAFFYRKKIIVSVRGELYPFALENFRPRLKKIFISIWKLFQKNIVIHCTVEKEKEYTKKIFKGNTKIVLLPNFILKPDTTSIRKVYSKKYILYLGRLHKIKGLENLFKSLKTSKIFMESDTVIRLAGKGEIEYVTKLKQLVEELGITSKVEFLNQVEGNDKEQLIANAYFLCLPSYTENFGNVVVEALIHGTPVIASKGTPWEMLNTNKAGFWVDNSVADLSQVLSHIYNLDRDAYEKMSTNAKKIATEEFDIRTNYKKWEECYINLANNG